KATRAQHTGGLDVKYNLTSSLTMDATFNTDFAQVEVDEEQINLTRFDLFFPEKRPFFLENSGTFEFGSPREVEIFFSRRIGIEQLTTAPSARMLILASTGMLIFLIILPRASLPGGTPATRHLLRHLNMMTNTTALTWPTMK